MRFLGAAVCVVGVVAAVLAWPTAPSVSAARADRAIATLTAAEPGVHLVSWRVGHTRPRHRPVDGAGDHDRPLDDRTPHDDDHAPYHCTQHDGSGDHVDHARPDHDRPDHHHHDRPAPGVPSAAAAAGGG